MLLVRPLPENEESFRGYLFRVADANGLPGIRPLLETVNLSCLNSTGSPLLRCLGRKESELSLLAGLVPKSDGYRESMQFSRSLPERYWNRSHPRCCPKCLAEHQVWLSQWELALSVSCPHHRIRLQDICNGCGRQLSWHRTDWMECECGVRLSDLPAVPCNDGEYGVSKQLYRLLHGMPPESDSLAPDVASLPGFLALIGFLGAYAIRPQGTRPLKTASVYPLEGAVVMVRAAGEILSDWPDNFHQYLSRMQRDHEQHKTLKDRFGHFYHSLYRNFVGESYAFLHLAFEDYLKRHWQGALNRRHSRFAGTTLAKQTMLPLPEAAKLLELSRNTVRSLLDGGNLAGSRRTLPSGRVLITIDRASLHSYMRSRKTLISAKEARKILGFGKRLFQRLLNDGIVRAVSGPIVDGKPVWRFEQEDIRALAEDSQRLRLPKQNASLANSGLIGIPEVAKRLRIKQEVAYHLIRTGLLPFVDYAGKRSGSRAVTESDLSVFCSRYVTAADMAKQVNRAPRYLVPWLAQHGIVPVCGPEVDGCRQYFYRREVIQILETIDSK